MVNDKRIVVDGSMFESLLKVGLGADWDRALRVFNNYGPWLSYDVTNTLLHAVDADCAHPPTVGGPSKTSLTLDALERHFRDALEYDHPDLRGREMRASTYKLFINDIFRVILGMETLEDGFTLGKL